MFFSVLWLSSKEKSSTYINKDSPPERNLTVNSLFNLSQFSVFTSLKLQPLCLQQILIHQLPPHACKWKTRLQTFLPAEPCNCAVLVKCWIHLICYINVSNNEIIGLVKPSDPSHLHPFGLPAWNSQFFVSVEREMMNNLNTGNTVPEAMISLLANRAI